MYAIRFVFVCVAWVLAVYSKVQISSFKQGVWLGTRKCVVGVGIMGLLGDGIIDGRKRRKRRLNMVL